MVSTRVPSSPLTNTEFRISGFDAQLSIEIAALSALTTSIREGHYTHTLGLPTSVVLLGHSFGSYVSSALTTLDPSIADAIVLTGYSLAGADTRVILEGFSPRIANLQDPDKFGALDVGYLTTADVFANINSFFKAPFYEPDVADYVEKNKQPFAITEILSLRLTPAKIEQSNFTGPALVMSGEFDFIVCGGFCPGVMENSTKQMYSNSKDFEAYVQPGTGHALTFSKNATGSYDVISGFLERNGL